MWMGVAVDVLASENFLLNNRFMIYRNNNIELGEFDCGVSYSS